MKKLLAAVVSFFLILALTACSSGSNTVNNDFTEYEYKYFNSVATSTVTAYSWDSASQIAPDYLVQFFGDETSLSRLSTDAEPAVIPGDTVESFIQLFFVVDNNHIRQSSYYDSSNNTYKIPIPGGGAASTKVVGVSEKDDILTLSYEYYSPADDVTVIRTGTLTIQRLDPRKYKYVSCNTTSV